MIRRSSHNNIFKQKKNNKKTKFINQFEENEKQKKNEK